MRRIHTFVIAVVLAVAAVAGLFAVSRTTQLGAATRAQVPARQLAARNRQLDRIEKALLAQAQGSPRAATRAAAQASTIYVRPKPIVRVVHRAAGEHENETEGDGGFDD
jgi:hypothetical protein